MRSCGYEKWITVFCVACILVISPVFGAEEGVVSYGTAQAANRPLSSLSAWAKDQMLQIQEFWSMICSSSSTKAETPKCGFLPGQDHKVKPGEMITVPAGSFLMGRSYEYDDDYWKCKKDGGKNRKLYDAVEGETLIEGEWEYAVEGEVLSEGEWIEEEWEGEDVYVEGEWIEEWEGEDDWDYDDRPVHTVQLNKYEIGKYPVTNGEFAAVLNWANSKGLLTDSKGELFKGGTVYAYGVFVTETSLSSRSSQINFINGSFKARSQEGYKAQLFSMGDHPVSEVTWYGAVCYCNWLSEKEGLQPCYDTTAWERYEPVRKGYRLPTEAEWERAAAWDGKKHWHYAMTSDSIDFRKANYEGANPLRLDMLILGAGTSPVGWYNGKNPMQLDIPEILTLDSKSPVGAYDMSGNVMEWCHDWYNWYYYKNSPEKNPTGPESGYYRVFRGGSWSSYDDYSRSAYRDGSNPSFSGCGFRLARTP